ncbi:hypothetical protein E4K72_17965 [Oxalobacteraceae bacterium OM1]|nr:hypothetical protein E4K72_17965 [Oxalobacteraceae bacterium OM1]
MLATWTLTASADNVTGGTNNDVINGAVDYGNGTTPSTASTFTVADQINGGTGTDTLNLSLSNANGGVNLPAVAVSNVETINLRNVTGQTLTVDASLLAGATAINADRSTSAVTLTNVAGTTAVGAIGDGTVTTAALTATYNAGVKAATLNLSKGVNGGAVTINGNGDNLLTALTINSTGAANKTGGIATPSAVTSVTINAATDLTTGGITNVAAATTIKVSGAATTVDLGTLAANATTVDASGLTAGGIKASLAAVTDKVTGGAGNDTITTNSIVLTTGSVDAGAGTGDKLIVSAAADLTSTTAPKYTNFEILQNNAAATLDASLVSGISSVVINNAGASGFTNLSAAQAGAVSVLQSTAGSTLALKDATGTADVVKITGTTTTASTAVNVTNLVVTGVETLNYTNSATAASTLSLAGAGSTGLKTITVAGSKGVTLDVAAAGTPAHATTLTAIDASALTAQATGTNTFTLQDTVGGHALKAGLTVTGSAGDDVFSFGSDTIASGIVQVNGGAGNDNLTASIAQLFTTGAGAIAFDGGANATGGDTLPVTHAAAGTISDSIFATGKNVENLKFSNTGAISLTSGGFFNSAFASGVTIIDGATTTNAVTFDMTLYSGAAKITNVGTTGVQTITGGSGADTIDITSAVAATGAGTVTIKGGAGDDTIKVTDASAIAANGSIDITGGTGADKITLSVTDNTNANSFVTLHVGTGESAVGAADIVTGFYVTGATRKVDTIDFAGAAIKPAAGITTTAVTGNTLAELSFAVSTAGQLTFSGTKAAALTAAQVEAIWTSQVSSLLNNLETVVWADANAADTQNGNSLVFNHNTGGDSEVILVGVQATATGAAAATANLVGIA